MLSRIREFAERTVVRNSPSSLVRWAKAAPRPLIEKMQADAFRRTVRYAARHQKFFASQLRTRGIDPRGIRRPADLGDFFTRPEDVVALPPEEFLCRKPQAVFETTGTSGPPKRIYFGYDELDRSACYEAAALKENGVARGDRVVCTFDAGYWVSSWVTFLACKQLGVLCSAVGKPHPRDVYARMGVYGYNVIAADPTWLVSFTEIAEKEGTFPLKLILAAGDRMTDVYRKYVEDVWKTRVVLGYGSTEAGGGMGMECRHQRGYHLDEYNFLFEIINSGEDGFGELVFTTLSRRTEPFIRYRARDISRIDASPCPCGATLLRLEMIRGRSDDMVVMGAGNLHPVIFERVLCDVKGISGNWQVAVRQEGLRDILEFRLELTNGIEPGVVEESVSHNLEARYPEIWANHVCDMYRLAFKFVPAGSFPAARKPRRLVDERAAG
ncbi:MAG: phenylacetate--CoA ligase family protein [Acidobacteriota bacterium]|nr:phenylacetate--CoA ligase family protein [Acidobacteriota bacterium]